MLDVLTRSIVKTDAREAMPESSLCIAEVNNQPSRELLTEKMLADRWACSVASLQRWRNVGEGLRYLKIVGNVLYRLKDLEAYEEACLVRKLLEERTPKASKGLETVRTTWNSSKGSCYARSKNEPDYCGRKKGWNR